VLTEKSDLIMVDDNSPQLKTIRKIPRSKDNVFNIRDLSMREFEAFMILLMHEGEKLSILKQIIDLDFDDKSATKDYHTSYSTHRKGYDHINNLCKKGFAYKKKIKGKQETRIYVRATIRKKYEKFILPTVNSISESFNDIIKDYMDGIKEEEKIREKFKAYTEIIIKSIDDLITKAPVKTLSSKGFKRKINDTIWKYYNGEILKYEVFSK